MAQYAGNNSRWDIRRPALFTSNRADGRPRCTNSSIQFFPTSGGISQPIDDHNRCCLAGGLRIEPNDTRFGRVATTIGLSETLGTLKVGFRDHVASKYVLVLVFFDRPCRLTGTLRASNGQIWSANVAIEKAGLAWLKMGDGHVTAAAVPSHFMFVISHP